MSFKAKDGDRALVGRSADDVCSKVAGAGVLSEVEGAGGLIEVEGVVVVFACSCSGTSTLGSSGIDFNLLHYLPGAFPASKGSVAEPFPVSPETGSSPVCCCVEFSPHTAFETPLARLLIDCITLKLAVDMWGVRAFVDKRGSNVGLVTITIKE